MEYEATSQQPQSDGSLLLKAHCCSHPAKQPLWILWRTACYRLVRSFNCESRACYVGNPRESFFSSSRKSHFFSRKFRKVGYYNHYVKGCHPLPPGVRQEKGTREFRFGSGSVPCVVVLVDNHTLLREQPSFPKARLRDSQTPWS